MLERTDRMDEVLEDGVHRLVWSLGKRGELDGIILRSMPHLPLWRRRHREVRTSYGFQPLTVRHVRPHLEANRPCAVKAW